MLVGFRAIAPGGDIEDTDFSTVFDARTSQPFQVASPESFVNAPVRWRLLVEGSIDAPGCCQSSLQFCARHFLP